jgi:hypothetical protein
MGPCPFVTADLLPELPTTARRRAPPMACQSAYVETRNLAPIDHWLR